MRRFLVLLLLVLPLSALHAQTTTVPILMLSDIHFDPDPTQDPTVVQTLINAGPTNWATVLGGKGSDACPTKLSKVPALNQGTDTSYALFIASLCAEKAYFASKQETPLFITVSGDLTRHSLSNFVPASSYSTFAADIVQFVAYELHNAFPNSPVYFALGNNDSGCDDYHEDATSPYLTAGATSLASAVLSAKDKSDITTNFPTMGHYSVKLPSPVNNTRLIVMQDIYDAPARKYASCTPNGAPPPGADLTWLEGELSKARSAGERVWVMAHIPPGIDGYSSSKGDAGCPTAGNLNPFQSSESIGDLLNANSDVLSLVLFAHTHMDEMRLFSNGTTPAPGRLTPSITPYDGNTPSFTVGKLDPTNATLIDYTVYSYSGDLANAWYKEYKYSEVYNQPDFSGASLQTIASGFIQDTAGSSQNSLAYQGWYSVVPSKSGGTSLPRGGRTSRDWPYFACSVSQLDATAYTNCVCNMNQSNAKALAK